MTYLKITYADLVNLRNTSKLTSGIFYRITDYVTTTTQEGTKSAGHPFDVIVRADSENKLNEEAYAIQHVGDEYFANSDLNAWKIWYCIDNDINRFAWADGTNGKGVIYRMIDEWNNDVPYDFKNIQFKHPKNTTTYPYYYYTFASGNVEDNTDCSLDIANSCYSNTIREYIDRDKRRRLNCIIFIGSVCYKNYFETGCYNNTFGEACIDNSFMDGCFGNSFEYNCNSNSFGYDCWNNSFSDSCWNNYFGNECYGNSLADSCSHNVFGGICINNKLEYNCDYNSFGSNCSDNSILSFGKNNSFGNNCDYNSLGIYCDGNSFGNNCSYVKFSHHYYYNNHFGDGCYFIVFTGAETASSTSQVQNYNFAQGIQGTSDTYLTVAGKDLFGNTRTAASKG